MFGLKREMNSWWAAVLKKMVDILTLQYTVIYYMEQ